ncbi:MAG: MFS transporter, partial [Pseudomonadota bacterium]|nr:MFS transporter [Pseudomonadota bacterium]
MPLYWRLSSFYFFYFGTLGAMMPYWGLYLQSLGFEAQAIGELIAIIMATKMIAPNIWGWLADRSQRHIRLVRISSFLASICFTGVFWGHSYYWLAFIMILFSFFWNAALPQFEATTLAHLGQQARRYSHIRLWGSIGFILTVGLFGHLFEHIHIQFLPWFILGLLTSIGLSSLLVPEAHKAPASGIPVAFHQILRQPAVIALFSVFLLMQASHGPYYAFYSIYL